MKERKTLKLRVDPYGVGSIAIDEFDISDSVQRVELVTDVNAVNKVTVTFIATHLDVEADVTEVSPTIPRPAEKQAFYSSEAGCWFVPLAGDVLREGSEMLPVEPARVELRDGQLWITVLETDS